MKKHDFSWVKNLFLQMNSSYIYIYILIIVKFPVVWNYYLSSPDLLWNWKSIKTQTATRYSWENVTLRGFYVQLTNPLGLNIQDYPLMERYRALMWPALIHIHSAGINTKNTHTHTHTLTLTHTQTHSLTHTQTHTLTHTHTCWFCYTCGDSHRRNGFCTVQTVYSIALHQPYT